MIIPGHYEDAHRRLSIEERQALDLATEEE